MKPFLSGHFRPFILLFTFFLLLTGLQSCKKSSGSSSTNSQYYFTASINGQAWAANVSNNSYNAPALAGLGNSNGINYVLVLGIKGLNKDTSAFELVFPQAITLNTAINFNASAFIAGVYAAQTAPGATTYDGYSTTAGTGSGTITITGFDQTAKIVEGTFTGDFGSTTGTATLQVTNGKFRCPYIQDVSQLPTSGLKF